VIVRLAFSGTVVDMGENAEPELRILIEDLPLRNVVTEMSGDESVILQNLLDERADFLAALDTGIVRQDAMTRIRKLRESVAHQPTSCLPTVRLYAADGEPILYGRGRTRSGTTPRDA
jgi:hypothetical protein